MRTGALLLTGVALACGPKEQPVPTTRTTYRALAGLSMGAIGTAAIGFRHIDQFDAFASLGAPLDASLLLRTVDQFHLGGFCPLQQLEANLDALNSPDLTCLTHPNPLKYEHVQDFNHWVYTTNTPFDRTGYVGLFTDLTLAFGNLLTENPGSTFAPPGVDPQMARRPPADICRNPVVVKGLKNREYNPDGSRDAITFCDGEPKTWFCTANEEVVDFCSDPANVARPLPRAAEQMFAAAFCAQKGGAEVATRMSKPQIMLRAGGKVDRCRETFEPVLVALAWDLNRNGRRDYAEPLVNNGQERFEDVGPDGCSDAREDGKGGCRDPADPAAVDPNHDNYDADHNPKGNEANWRHDPGEPFLDDGLDGLPGTKDFGEGNGSFDMTSGRRRLYAYDPRSRLTELSPAQLSRVNLLVDGGIRDLFNFGLLAHQVFGLWKVLRPDDSKSFRDWTEIPGMADPRTGSYRPWGGPWARAGRNLEVLFGKEEPTLEDRLVGDGDHVGSNSQAVYRIATLFNWVAAQWPSLPRPSTPLGGTPYEEREKVAWFESKALGTKRGYGVFLPPGYELPENAAVRYPVLYLLHGYTGEPRQILPSAFLADTFMKDTSVKLRPMIIVTPSGACCFVHSTGARDCREEDDSGASFKLDPQWRRECVGGSFFVDHVEGGKYEESFFELIREVDAKYRTLPPIDVAQR